MFDIIVLIFLARHIGIVAHDKGLSPGRWKLYTVLAWLAGEFVGIIIGVLIFGTNDYISVILVGITGAVTGYFILKANLSKQPNADIDQLGNN